MKQFIYLDVDKINSIIAQKEKGLIDEITTEKEKTIGKEKKTTVEGEISTDFGGSLWKLAKAEASINAGVDLENSKEKSTATKKIIAKTLHDAAFDIAYNAISPSQDNTGNEVYDTGDYVEINRYFDFVDFDYLEGLFSPTGIVEYLKKSQKEKITADLMQQKEQINRETQRQNKDIIRKILNEKKQEVDMQYDEIHLAIKAIAKIIPYKRMLVSSDGYLIPVEDENFRINPTSLGFMYGGEMKCVGMITNIIGEEMNPNDSNNIFATLQFTVNEVLRSVIPTTQNNIYVMTPLAIYYEK